MNIKYYSVEEAGEKLGVTRQRVHQYITAGQISYEWVGKFRVISGEAIKNVRRKPNYHKINTED